MGILKEEVTAQYTKLRGIPTLEQEGRRVHAEVLILIFLTSRAGLSSTATQSFFWQP